MFVLATTPLAGQGQDHVLGPAQWRQDLEELAEHVRENHRDPFHTVARAEFEAAVEDLARRLPSLDGVVVTLELARLTAMIGDGHTRLTLPYNVEHFGFQFGHTPDPDPRPGAPRFHTLPVRFGAFAEGVHVVATTEPHRNLLGARLVEVGGRPVDDVLDAVAPFVAHDTPSGLRFLATRLLGVPEILVAAGITTTVQVSDVVFATSDGARRTVRLASVGYEEDPHWTLPRHVVPRGADAPYFTLERHASGALVVRVAQINDSPTEPIGAFARRLAEALDADDPPRVVLDLRECHGGDQALGRALVLPLIRWAGSRAPGRLFALVGPETFSAAVNLASRLEEWTQVIFVGEPLGSPPSHYSSSDREVLDHSGLVVRVSTGYFVGWTGTEWRESVEIGLPVQPRIRDFLDGEDTALRAALAYAAPAGVASQVVDAYERAGINAALIAWSHFRTDPATAAQAGPEVGNVLARHLRDTGQARYAAAIYLYNREFHPGSVEAYLGEAEVRHELGEQEQALQALDAAARIAPDDARIARLRARIRSERS